MAGQLTNYSAFPWGKGDRSRKARVDEGCFRLSWASQICITTATSCALTRIYLAERLLVLTLSQFRAYRGAGAGLLEICMHFSSSLRARAARLCVRPKSLSASRGRRSLCSLGVSPISFCASRFARKFFSLPPLVGKVAFRPKGEMTDEGVIANC